MAHDKLHKSSHELGGEDELNILPGMLDATIALGSAMDGYVPTYDETSGKFTWAEMKSSIIIDEDNDTSVDVEESADEDKIRMKVAGTEMLRLEEGYSVLQNDKVVICSVFTSAGINACIDALGAEGGMVFLPEGVYAITSTITIDANNTALIGGGWGTKLDASAWSTSDVINLNGKSYLYLANFQIEGYDGGGNSKNLIYDGGTVTNSTFENLWLHHSDYMGFQSGSGASDKNTIRNCLIEFNDNDGIRFYGDHWEITGCQLNNNKNYAISSLSDSSFNNISNNQIEGNTLAGIRIDATGNTIDGNFVWGNGEYGIYITSGAHNVISDNFIGNNTRDGIYVTSSDNATIIGNLLYGNKNGYNDIYLNNSDYATITGNSFDMVFGGRSERGVYLVDSDYCNIVGNTSRRHDTCGIELDATSDNNHIAWNNLEGEAVAKIINNGSNNTIMNAVAGKISLAIGTGINEFSTDGALAGNSDDAVPTEKAVKTYADTNKSAKHISINTQTDNYTLVLSDDDKLIDMNKATAVTLTVPTNASVAFPIGTTIALRQKGAGKVTITPAGGVTIDSQYGLITTGQHAMASILKVDTDTWVAVGSLESA